MSFMVLVISNDFCGLSLIAVHLFRGQVKSEPDMTVE